MKLDEVRELLTEPQRNEYDYLIDKRNTGQSTRVEHNCIIYLNQIAQSRADLAESHADNKTLGHEVSKLYKGVVSYTEENKQLEADLAEIKEQCRFQEIIDRVNYKYLKTGGTIEYPNSYEGDVLKIAYKSACRLAEIVKEGK